MQYPTEIGVSMLYARTISAALVPGKADEAIRIFHDQVIPMIETQPGYVRTTLLVDRENNQAMTITIWESKEGLESTGQGTQYLKDAVNLLVGCVVPKTYSHWDVGTSTA